MKTMPALLLLILVLSVFPACTNPDTGIRWVRGDTQRNTATDNKDTDVPARNTGGLAEARIAAIAQCAQAKDAAVYNVCKRDVDAAYRNALGLPPPTVTPVPVVVPLPPMPTPTTIAISCKAPPGASGSERFFRITSLVMTPVESSPFVRVTGEVENLCDRTLHVHLDIAALDGTGGVVGSTMLPVTVCGIPAGSRSSFSTSSPFMAPGAVKARALMRPYQTLSVNMQDPPFASAYNNLCYGH